jgi:methylmalonyl-CoA/ethylmalonyl-CoA epimerase
MNAPDAMGGAGAPRAPQAAGVIGLSHIAIATRDAAADAALLVAALGGTRGAEELLDQGALRVRFVSLGPVNIELLEPRSPDHTVAKFLETRGPGLHHVSYEVADLSAALERCRAAGVRLIDETPRAGAQGSRVAFLHPKSVGGVLIELCESRRRS